ncbi:hypothetical protein GCM10023146_07600 [Nocardioides caricicola]|uniref:hypothetical protein n=1 Tax=Nocardioides caricicola TaxID=634770 RepID=UPI0031E84806
MPRLSSVVIHCADPAVLAPFWSLVTGIPILEEDARAIAEGTLEDDESVLLRGPEGHADVWLTPATHRGGRAGALDGARGPGGERVLRAAREALTRLAGHFDFKNTCTEITSSPITPPVADASSQGPPR